MTTVGKTGEWAGDFTQWIPKEGAKPSQETQFKILYDDKNLYVAIRAFDNEPKKISRKGGRRDLLIGEQAGVNFDSYHDHRTGFEFSVTATGQKVDLILTNPWEADFNWECRLVRQNRVGGLSLGRRVRNPTQPVALQQRQRTGLGHARMALD